MKKQKAVLFSLPVLFLFSLAPVGADDHFVERGTRDYMGSTMMVQLREVWIGEKATSVADRLTVITRYDLGKRWTLAIRAKRYLEEPIEQEKKAEPVAKPQRVQELGWNYRPQFEWTIAATTQEKVIDGRKCRLYLAHGEADYADETRDMWLTKDLPIDVGRMAKHAVRPDDEPLWQALCQAFPDLKHSISLETEVKSEPAIAPASVSHFKVHTIESAAPPPGIYEIPEGFRKVNSPQELTAR
ncbi:MAG: hypothetical protein EHM61_11070 [Acidobacteria bacterium]|nr:MAG: hypothetical protein EHM61_11070 [Acidobacteriota bacterium]